VDRSGLNDHHAVVRALYEAIDRVLRPLIAAEEKRAGAHLIRPGQALKARDQVGLKAVNDALKGAFDTPGKAAFDPGDQPTDRPPAQTCERETGRPDEPAPGEPEEPLEPEQPEEPPEPEQAESAPAEPAPLRFRQALIRLHPGERRGVSLLINPHAISPGTPRETHARLPRRRSLRRPHQHPAREPTPPADLTARVAVSRRRFLEKLHNRIHSDADDELPVVVLS
jgi:hypothetical protein